MWADLGGDRKNKDMGFYCLDLAVTRKVTLDKFSFIFKLAFSQENRTNMSWSLQMMSPYHNLERSLSELRRKLKKSICDSLTCYDDDIVPCNSFMFCLTNLYSQQPNANETVMQDVH